MFIESYLLMLLYRSPTFLLSFCFLVLSAFERGVFKLLIVVVDLSISPCSYINFCFISLMGA